ncbi:MAG: hypothetical protein K6G20_02700 [Ruminococcus sp.]|nr:hypothetical protein [Ruminococcus sp.]
MKIKKISKRIISIFLTMVTVVTMLAAVTITANAEYFPEKYEPRLGGRAHVQSLGWINPTSNTGINGIKIGTEGQALRLECIELGIYPGTDPNWWYIGGISIKTYSGNKWSKLSEAPFGKLAKSGTEGEAKCIKAVKINLTGLIANGYDIYYRLHLQSSGWETSWHKNGETAGSINNAKRVEAIEVKLVHKN